MKPMSGKQSPGLTLKRTKDSFENSLRHESGFQSLPMKAILFICGGLILAILNYSCKSGEISVYRDSKIIMGTVVEVTVAHGSEVTARMAIDQAMQTIQEIDEIMSPYKPESVISRINRDAASGNIDVGKDVFALIKDSIALSRESHGAFDITLLPIMALWGFDQGGQVPDSQKIADNLKLVGFEKLDLDDNNHSVGFKVPGMGLDLGAIAKGWAVDRAMEKIRSLGITDAIIDAGGDLRVIGSRPGKKFWRIGVQHPREQGALVATFDLRDTAIVTSGDYERYFVADGIRYHHILDPGTGFPARGCQSVTVLAATTAEADACATAAFVLGPEKGLSFLRSRPGVRGLIVGADGALHWTDEELARMARR